MESSVYWKITTERRCMMVTGRVLLVAALAGGSFVMCVLPAAAQQGCGSDCFQCGDHKFESDTTGGPYDSRCIGPTETACAGCDSRSLSERVVGASAIAKVVEAASSMELRAVLAAYGDRLLLNAARNILVIKGNGCDRDDLGTVVFLSPAKTREFARLNAPRLAKFLAVKQATPPRRRAGA
jgi:hypothetical protein